MTRKTVKDLKTGDVFRLYSDSRHPDHINGFGNSSKLLKPVYKVVSLDDDKLRYIASGHERKNTFHFDAHPWVLDREVVIYYAEHEYQFLPFKK